MFVLMQSVLQMGVTRHAPCYDASVVDERLDPVLDLANVITATRTTAKNAS